jgi:ribonucleoside-triphosphate reductase
VHVETPIDPFKKLEVEAKFQKLSKGGAISYIETANLENNLEAVLTVIQYIYDNIMYAELNTKSDYCQECGWDREIPIVEDEHGKLIWKCPNCGNTDASKMNIARRTCGYIGLNGFNQGRVQEIAQRYVHLDCHECGC